MPRSGTIQYRCRASSAGRAPTLHHVSGALQTRTQARKTRIGLLLLQDVVRRAEAPTIMHAALTAQFLFLHRTTQTNWKGSSQNSPPTVSHSP